MDRVIKLKLMMITLDDCMEGEGGYDRTIATRTPANSSLTIQPAIIGLRREGIYKGGGA